MRSPLSLILALVLLMACSGCFFSDRGGGGYGERDHGGYDDRDHGEHGDRDRGGHEEQH